MATDEDKKPSDFNDSKNQNQENSSDSPSQPSPPGFSIKIPARKPKITGGAESIVKAASLDNTEQTKSEPVNPQTDEKANPDEQADAIQTDKPTSAGASSNSAKADLLDNAGQTKSEPINSQTDEKANPDEQADAIQTDKPTSAGASSNSAKADLLDNAGQTKSEPVNSQEEVSPNPLSNPTDSNEAIDTSDNNNVIDQKLNDRDSTQDPDSEEDSIDIDIAIHDDYESVQETLQYIIEWADKQPGIPVNSKDIVFKDYNIPHGHKELLFGDDQILLYKTNMRKAFVLVNSAIGLKKIDLAHDDTDHDDWLYYCLRTAKDEIEKEKDKKAAFNAIRVLASKEGTSITQDLRIYKDEDDDKIYYDLGDLDNDRYLILSKEGYEIRNALNLRFVHFDVNSIQVDPVSEGSLDLLDKYVNLTGDDLFMLKIYLLASYIPDIQHPILALLGGESSGKTTIAKYLVKLIDPSISETLSKPTEKKSLLMNFFQHYFMAYDNLSEIEKSLSDELCRVVTGSSNEFRKLFTNATAMAMDFQRAFIITGLGFEDLRPDLIDRFLIFNLNRIIESGGMTDTQRNSMFDEEKPRILGAIFNIISKAMSIFPTVDIEVMPRFADFQKWGYAFAEVLEEGSGQKFMRIYHDKLDINMEAKVKNNPLIIAIAEIMIGKDIWRGKMETLMHELDKKASDMRLDINTDEWPGGSNRITGKLRQHYGLLLYMGFEIIQVQKASRTYEIRRIPGVEDHTTQETT